MKMTIENFIKIFPGTMPGRKGTPGAVKRRAKNKRERQNRRNGR